MVHPVTIMSLSATPHVNRFQLAFIGKRNSGKSSLMNALTGQALSIVSAIPGTTTDPVKKAMEIPPLGPVTLIDTPGVDDVGDLGELRVKETHKMLMQADGALLIIDQPWTLDAWEVELLEFTGRHNIPLIIVLNQIDKTTNDKALQEIQARLGLFYNCPVNLTSTLTLSGIEELKNTIAKTFRSLASQNQSQHKFLVKDLCSPFDTVILVIPIDASAPQGRLILPQQQVIRELLENDVTVICIKETALAKTLDQLKNPPQLVITDSQIFSQVADILPKEIPLTSFSILFARFKGDLKRFVENVKIVDTLPNNARILIAEGCTHHQQCEDIGRVKLPNWLEKYTQKRFQFTFTSGNQFPDTVEEFDFIIHCGACMLHQRQIQHRLHQAEHVPITNYGILIAYLNEILDRVIGPFDIF